MEEKHIDWRQRIIEIGNKNKKSAEKNAQKFYLGRLYVSEGCERKGLNYSNIELGQQFGRYIVGDWGDIPKEDVEINNRSVDSGYGDILGVYDVTGIEVWIHTSLDKEVETTIFLPDEY